MGQSALKEEWHDDVESWVEKFLGGDVWSLLFNKRNHALVVARNLWKGRYVVLNDDWQSSLHGSQEHGIQLDLLENLMLIHSSSDQG